MWTEEKSLQLIAVYENKSVVGPKLLKNYAWQEIADDMGLAVYSPQLAQIGANPSIRRAIRKKLVLRPYAPVEYYITRYITRCVTKIWREHYRYGTPCAKKF